METTESRYKTRESFISELAFAMSDHNIDMDDDDDPLAASIEGRHRKMSTK